MQKLLVAAATALSLLAVPGLADSPAEAKSWKHHRNEYDHAYRDGYRDARYAYRDDRGYRQGYRDGRRAAASGWYGRNGRYYSDYAQCKKDSNIEGTVLGAVAGGVLGNVIAPQGDKRVGTAIGAVAGGVIGNRIDAGEGRRRCY